MPHANVELIRRHHAAFARGDFEGALAVMHPDIEWDLGMIDSEPAHGRDAVIAATRRWLGTFDEYTFEVLDYRAIGSHVLVRARNRGRGKGSGALVENDGFQLWTIEDGLAIRMVYTHTLEQALALIESDPPPFRIMGVVNVTPDSFSDGGLWLDADAAVEHGLDLAAQGADILDIGGESTRPGSEGVAEEEELRRVLPVVGRLAAARVGVQVSIDTSKLAVARAALETGASYVNDVTAFRAAPELAGLVADRGAECCLMHMLGEPRTMQQDPQYDDVVSDVKAFLEERLAFVVGEGVPEERVMLDPGIGFGKTIDHNLELLRRLDEIVAIGRPVVIGTSRKSFIGRITGREVDDRVAGTAATNVLAFEHGARVFRVHDVAPARDALLMAAATVSGRWSETTKATSSSPTTS